MCVASTGILASSENRAFTLSGLSTKPVSMVAAILALLRSLNSTRALPPFFLFITTADTVPYLLNILSRDSLKVVNKKK